MDFSLAQKQFEASVSRAVTSWPWFDHLGARALKDSILYSLTGGGKRFRPVLCYLVAENFKVPVERVFPWALAVEMIHTYSLIHDDLPCMDDDDSRRGRPTNHKVFGEATALLAGDALLTEAFRVLASGYRDDPSLALELVELLTSAAGISGMVSGQAMDLHFQQSFPQATDRELTHRLKTGALIEGALRGSLKICNLHPDQIANSEKLGRLIGLAFQIKDDILDGENRVHDEAWLKEISKQAVHVLTAMQVEEGPLHQLVHWNRDRTA